MDPPAPGSIDEVFDRARQGDVAFIKRWLDGGADINCPVPYLVAGEPSNVRNRGKTVIMAAAERGQIEMMRMLLSRGADVNFVRAGFDHWPKGQTALYFTLFGNHRDAARWLLAHGASKNVFEWCATNGSSRAYFCIAPTEGAHARLRMFYIAGVDLSRRYLGGGLTYDQAARADLAKYRNNPRLAPIMVPHLERVVEVFDGVRDAGSYANWVLGPYKELLRIRSLVARGRAKAGPQTPSAAGRLFGPTTPGPAFWLVMEYWELGDWRRP